MTMRHFTKAAQITVVAVLLGGLFSACAGNQEFSVVDLRSRLGDVFKETTGNIDNTNGADELDINVNAKRQFQHDITLKMTSASTLDPQKVNEKILSTYDIKDAGGEKSCVIPAQVPAGHIYAYDIEWTQVIREGNIVEGTNNPNGNLLGTYSIIIDLQCQVVGVEVKK